MNVNHITPRRPHGLHRLDPDQHASPQAPGAPWRCAGVLRSSRSRSRPGGRSQRPVVAALLAALAFVLLAAPAAAQNEGPGAPTGFTITKGHRALKLDWTAPADNGGSAITGYELQGSKNTATGSTSTSYVIDTSSATGGWLLRVRAVNANGNGPWSDDRAQVSGPATVTIASTGPMVISEPTVSEELRFILTADRPVLLTSRPLNVSVLVSETNQMISDGGEGTKTVGFALGAQTATLTAYLAPDNTNESDSDVTAAI